MMPLRKSLAWSLASFLVLTVACDQSLPTDVSTDHMFKGGKPTGHEAGNNLSYPVIWAEGVQKVPPGTPGMEPTLLGEWWYWWGTMGTDPNVTPLSCPPDPEYPTYCDDGLTGVEPTVQPAPSPDLVRAYLQKDPQNIWQAESADWSASPVAVDSIDWGDNLESVDWYTRSQVRAEVVLFQNLATPMTEYEMRHTSGWGIDEAHGLAADLAGNEILGPGTHATVYSPCARFTIQKLLVPRDDIVEGDLTWVPGDGWTETVPEASLINAPIFNMAVHESSDGPGYYNAEINVKGRIIYGYTWNVRRLNEGAGDYRLTFSFDATCGAVSLNTFFVEGVTGIMAPEEEELLVAAAEEGESPGGGGTSGLDFINNLTHMDISIHERSGGGGGGGKKGGGGGGGPPSGNRGGNH